MKVEMNCYNSLRQIDIFAFGSNKEEWEKIKEKIQKAIDKINKK